MTTNVHHPSSRYLRWAPIDAPLDALALDSLKFEASDLAICLTVNGGRVLRIVFEAPVAYRGIPESYRLRTWNEAAGNSLAGLHTVEDSEWVDWLRNESGGVLASVTLKHYAIHAGDDCIDVVTEFEPTVEWVR